MTDKYDIHIGQKVREKRIQLGMSQEALAERLGITFQQVQKYEKATNRISSGRLQRIADVFGVPVNSFFQGIGDSFKAAASPMFAVNEDTPSMNDIFSSKESVELLKAYYAIKDADKRRDMLKAIQAAANA